MSGFKIGRFVQKNSFMHGLHPLSVFVITTATAVSAGCAGSFLSLSVPFTMICVLIIASRIYLTELFTALKKSSIFVFSIFILNIVFGSGLTVAALLSSKLLIMISTSIILTYSTKPEMIAYSVEVIISPLKLFGINMREINQSTLVAIKSIPIFFDEIPKAVTKSKDFGLIKKYAFAAGFLTDSFIEKTLNIKTEDINKPKNARIKDYTFTTFMVVINGAACVVL